MTCDTQSVPNVRSLPHGGGPGLRSALTPATTGDRRHGTAARPDGYRPRGRVGAHRSTSGTCPSRRGCLRCSRAGPPTWSSSGTARRRVRGWSSPSVPALVVALLHGHTLDRLVLLVLRDGLLHLRRVLVRRVVLVALTPRHACLRPSRPR